MYPQFSPVLKTKGQGKNRNGKESTPNGELNKQIHWVRLNGRGAIGATCG